MTTQTHEQRVSFPGAWRGPVEGPAMTVAELDGLDDDRIGDEDGWGR